MSAGTDLANTHLTVRVLAPTHKLYEGPAVSVTASNKVGRFDVLAGHANFFSLLTAQPLAINTGVKMIDLPIDGGLMKVKSNTVTMFVNIGSN